MTKQNIIITILTLTLLAVLFSTFNQPPKQGEVNVEAQSSTMSESERLQTEALKAKAEAEKASKEAELKAKEAELAKQMEEVRQGIAELDTDVASSSSITVEEPPKAKSFKQ